MKKMPEAILGEMVNIKKSIYQNFNSLKCQPVHKMTKSFWFSWVD